MHGLVSSRARFSPVHEFVGLRLRFRYVGLMGLELLPICTTEVGVCMYQSVGVVLSNYSRDCKSGCKIIAENTGLHNRNTPSPNQSDRIRGLFRTVGAG